MSPEESVSVEPPGVGGATNQPLLQLTPALVVSVRLRDFSDELPSAPNHEILRVRVDAQPADLLEGILHGADLGDGVSGTLGRHREPVYHEVQHRRKAATVPQARSKDP